MYKIVTKGWGYEKWIVNNDLYCGKILFFNKGKKCSWHYHKIKDETFYIKSGSLMVIFSENDDISDSNTVILNQDDSIHMPVGMRHQMIGLEDTEMFEFSTTHFEEDSYRIIKGD